MAPRGRASIAKITQFVHMESMKSLRQIDHSTFDQNGSINFRKSHRPSHIAVVRSQQHNTSGLQPKHDYKIREDAPEEGNLPPRTCRRRTMRRVPTVEACQLK